MSGLRDEQVMLASSHKQAGAGNVDCAIEQQVADSLPKGSLAWRKIARGSPTCPSIFCRSKLYSYFLGCVLCCPSFRSLEP